MSKFPKEDLLCLFEPKYLDRLIEKEKHLSKVVDEIIQKLRTLKDLEAYSIPTGWSLEDGKIHTLNVNFVRKNQHLFIRIDDLNNQEKSCNASDEHILDEKSNYKLLGAIHLEELDNKKPLAPLQSYIENLLKSHWLLSSEGYRLNKEKACELIYQFRPDGTKNELFYKYFDTKSDNIPLIDFKSEKIRAQALTTSCKRLPTEGSGLSNTLKSLYSKYFNLKRVINSTSIPLSSEYVNLKLLPSSVSPSGPNSYSEYETTLELAKLFEKRKEQKLASKRVLIFGQPGIGKKTLPRLIISEWSQDKLWGQLFEGMFWIKLRDLLQYSEEKLNIEEILFRLCLSNTDTPTEDIKKFINNWSGSRYLLLLDGYDEIAGLLDSYKGLNTLLESLLSSCEQKYVILTSGPLPLKELADRQKVLGVDEIMELKGFTDKNIKSYVKQFVGCNESSNVTVSESEITSRNLLDQISRHPQLYRLAHVPIQLKLILTLWLEDRTILSEDFTMSDLYKNLMKKVVSLNLNKFRHFVSSLYSKKEIEFVKNNSMKALALIAFDAFQSQRMHISKKEAESLIKTAFSEIFPDGQDVFVLLANALQASGLVNFSSQNLEDYYCFRHVALQEFFAAQYITESITSGLETKECHSIYQIVVENKLNSRWQEVWCYVAGLLSDQADKKFIRSFFKLLLDEPRDISEEYQGLLLMRCLNETKIIDSDYLNLMERITKWSAILFLEDEQKVRDNYSLTPFVSNGIRLTQEIEELLQDDRQIMSFISACKGWQSKETVKNLLAQLESENFKKKEQALGALCEIAKHSASHQLITSLLRGFLSEKRNRTHIPSTNLDIPLIEAYYEDAWVTGKDVEKMAAAAYILGELSEDEILKFNLIDLLLKAFEDRDWDRRYTLAIALKKIIKKSSNISKDKMDNIIQILLEEFATRAKPDPFMQAHAVKPLGVIVKMEIASEKQSKKIIQTLIKVLDDYRVARQAKTGLNKIAKNKRLINKIIEISLNMYKDRDSSKSAKVYISELLSQGIKIPVSKLKDFIQVLLVDVQSENEIIAVSAMKTLVKIADNMKANGKRRL